MELQDSRAVLQEGVFDQSVQLPTSHAAALQSEHFVISEEEAAQTGMHFDPELHGSSGPIYRTLPKWTSNATKPVSDAMTSLGIAPSAESVSLFSV